MGAGLRLAAGRCDRALWHRHGTKKTLHDQHPNPASVPYFSIIVAVYNEWGAVERCLESLGGQENAAPFEVILVDDGSVEAAPESIRAWNGRYPLAVARQPHRGIAAARNLGVQTSVGSILVFTDADCQLQSNCLRALEAALLGFPQQSCFQLHLVSDRSSLMGRAEQLRLMSIQNQTLQPEGSIRYLNTAGFAIRRACISDDGRLFDPAAQRAEDTLLLAELIRRGQLPWFVSDAIVQHTIELSWAECLFKDIRSAWREGKTYDMIAAKRVTIRMGDRTRLKMMASMWKTANQPCLGRTAWFVVIARRTVHRSVRFIYNALRRFRKPLPEQVSGR
jgi:glycosyltransferase involved in cell wall biosynthesis